MADGCIFCRLVKGEIPAKVVFEADDLVAFHDVDPKAPVHVLVIPKRHLASVSTLAEEDAVLAGRLVLAGARVARETGIEEGGYRLVLNTGGDAGQSVAHIHMHVLGGRHLSWPPG